MDVDTLISRADALRQSAQFQRALEIYLFLAERDPSLDGGWLGVQIAECYEMLGRMIEARYWAGRAVEENPTLPDRGAIGDRLGNIQLDQITGPPPPTEWISGANEADADETRRSLQSIPQGQELLDWLGDQVSFHDAEVVSLHLNREGPSRLQLLVSGTRSTARVTFVLADWIDTTLNGFSHQNVIGDLILRKANHRPVAVWERGVGLRIGQFEIELLPIFGAYGLIRASIVEIELQVLS
jgi:tetratricopeptide (TPR) repeat protein